MGYHSQIILNGRIVNDSMGAFVADAAIKKMIEAGMAPKFSKVVILGLTFKENCPDCRNSKVADIINRLAEYGIRPEVVDPWADPEVAKHEYGVDLSAFTEIKDADCIIVAVAHQMFRDLGLDGVMKLFGTKSERVLIDVKGLFEIEPMNRLGLHWWRL